MFLRQWFYMGLWTIAIVAATCSADSLTVAPFGMHVPIARIKGSLVCCPLDSVTLDGWASICPGGEVTEWLWDLDGDCRIDTVATVGELRFAAPLQPCSRTIYLTVKERHGILSAPDSTILHVMTSAPRVTLASDTAIKVGVRLSFQPRVVSNCAKVTRYEWNFTDDDHADFHSDESGNTSRVFNRPGRYTVRFKVTDALGNEAGAIQIIRVFAAQPEKTGQAGGQ